MTAAELAAIVQTLRESLNLIDNRGIIFTYTPEFRLKLAERLAAVLAKTEIKLEVT